jgi:hypothetical protein
MPHPINGDRRVAQANAQNTDISTVGKAEKALVFRAQPISFFRPYEVYHI